MATTSAACSMMTANCTGSHTFARSFVAYKKATSSNFFGIMCCPPLCTLSLTCFSGFSSFGSLSVPYLPVICKRGDGCSREYPRKLTTTLPALLHSHNQTRAACTLVIQNAMTTNDFRAFAVKSQMCLPGPTNGIEHKNKQSRGLCTRNLPEGNGCLFERLFISLQTFAKCFVGLFFINADWFISYGENNIHLFVIWLNQP